MGNNLHNHAVPLATVIKCTDPLRKHIHGSNRSLAWDHNVQQLLNMACQDTAVYWIITEMNKRSKLFCIQIIDVSSGGKSMEIVIFVYMGGDQSVVRPKEIHHVNIMVCAEY